MTARRTPLPNPEPPGVPSTRRGRAAGALAAVLVVAGLVLVSVPSAAQQRATGEIRGRVLDAARNAPVAMARVEVPALGRHTLADGEGRFRFREVPPGTYRLRVAFLGYRTTVGRLEVEAGETREVELRVQPEPVRAEELEVTARSLTWVPGFLDRRESRRGHFFTRRKIEAADPDHLTELLYGARGVRIGLNRGAHGASQRYPQFYHRGPGEGVVCRPVVFVDGDLIGPGQPYVYFNEIRPEDVLALEVYYREQDVPDAIRYDGLHELPRDGDAPLVTDVASRGAGGASDVRTVLSGAGVDEVLDRDIPERDENLDLSETTLAGLYDRPPRLEHCGAIFVWTRFFPHRER